MSQQEESRSLASFARLKSSDFNLLRKSARTFKTPYFLFVYQISESTQGHHEVGWTLTRKIGKSHQRNRTKRLIRESLRSIAKIRSGELEQASSFKLNIVVLKKGNSDLSFYDVQSTISYFFESRIFNK